MKSTFTGAAAVALLAGVASANLTVQRAASDWIFDLQGNLVNGRQSSDRSPAGTTYTVFTGVGSATAGSFLIEPTAPPVRDDVVLFDGVEEQINDYVPAAPGGPPLAQRFVNETKTPTGAFTSNFSVTVRSVGGQLWPSGFTGPGGVALPDGVIGLGVTLPAALGGADSLDWTPAPNTITAATLTLFDANNAVLLGPVSILASLSQPGGDWNGVAGNFRIGAGAGAGVFSARFDFTASKIPTPGALALMGVAGLAAARRRR